MPGERSELRDEGAPPACNTGVRGSGRAYGPVPVPSAWWAGVDWVRLTLRPWDEGPVDDMVYWRAVRQLAELNDGAHLPAKPWARLGYYGEQIGKAAWGRSNQGLYLEVTGGWADRVAELRLPYDGVPRVDVQVTLWYDRPQPMIAQHCSKALYARYLGMGASGARPRLVDGFGAGDTCYSGSRNSSKFVRIYDKDAESAHDGAWRHAWRFEVQHANEAAKAVWPEPFGEVPAPEYWCSVVVRTLQERGVVLPTNLPAAAQRMVPPPQMTTDEERRLAWLHGQVRPAIDKLLAAGVSLDQVKDALGIT